MPDPNLIDWPIFSDFSANSRDLTSGQCPFTAASTPTRAAIDERRSGGAVLSGLRIEYYRSATRTAFSRENPRMRKTILFLLVCLLVVSAIRSQAASDSSSDSKTSLKSTLQLKMEEWHKTGSFPGATLGVVLSNGESFALAVGFSDRDTKTPMRPDSRMLAGSVGKTFAAATALQLIKEGKIGLDDKIEKYLGHEPWFSRLPNARDITVRQLMNHTSGLVRYEFKDQFTKDLTANPEKIWRPAELLSYLLDEKPPFEAGKGWDYSDSNYIVLGMIIGKGDRQKVL